MASAKATRRAFTLIELLVVATIIAVAATIVVPTFSNNDRLRCIAASDVLVSDLELAQVMTISFPEEPIIVRFHQGKGMWWLAEQSTPNVPILRDGTGEPYLVTVGEGRTSAATGVTFHVDGMSDNSVVFNATGGIANLSDQPHIVFQLNSERVRVEVAPTTGTIARTVLSK